MPCCDRYNASCFWIIPYSTVDVNGYDICEVPTPELTEMEENFSGINNDNYNEENSSEGDNSSEGY